MLTLDLVIRFYALQFCDIYFSEIFYYATLLSLAMIAQTHAAL